MIITKNLKRNILDQLKTKQLASVPASEAEYFSTVKNLPFKVEYYDSEIITIGIPSYNHEMLIANMIKFLRKLLSNKNFKVLRGNFGVQIPKFEGGIYMPDVVVTKGLPEYKTNSIELITNPQIIIEVISKGSGQIDMFEKFPEYKHIQSIQQVIFIYQNRRYVSSFIRSESSKKWINNDFELETDEVLIENFPVKLKDIYEQIEFVK